MRNCNSQLLFCCIFCVTGSFVILRQSLLVDAWLRQVAVTHRGTDLQFLGNTCWTRMCENLWGRTKMLPAKTWGQDAPKPPAMQSVDACRGSSTASASAILKFSKKSSTGSADFMETGIIGSPLSGIQNGSPAKRSVFAVTPGGPSRNLTPVAAKIINVCVRAICDDRTVNANCDDRGCSSRKFVRVPSRKLLGTLRGVVSIEHSNGFAIENAHTRRHLSRAASSNNRIRTRSNPAKSCRLQAGQQNHVSFANTTPTPSQATTAAKLQPNNR